MPSVDQNRLQLSLGSLDHHLEDAKTAPTESVLDTSLDDAGEESDSIATQILDEASQAALKSKKTEKQQEAKVAEVTDSAQEVADYLQWKGGKRPWYKPLLYVTGKEMDKDKEWAAHKKKQKKTAHLLAAILVKNAAVNNYQTDQDWIDHYRKNFIEGYGKGNPSASISNYGALQVAEGKPFPPQLAVSKPAASATPPAAKPGAGTPPLAMSTSPKPPKL